MPFFAWRPVTIRSRQTIIALLMIGALFFSMLVALVISGHREMHLGDLAFSVPARWTLMGPIQNPTVFADQVTYQPSDPTDQWISIARFHDPGPADFLQAYRLAIKTLQATHPLQLQRQLHSAPVTLGPLRGFRAVLFGVNPQDRYSQTIILLAILSDGHRYWMVCQGEDRLMDAYGHSASGSSIQSQAFDRVLASMRLLVEVSSPSPLAEPPSPPASLPASPKPPSSVSDESSPQPPI